MAPLEVVSSLTDVDRKAIAELETCGFTVTPGSDGLTLHAGPFEDVPALLKHLLHHGIRLGAAPICPDCGPGSCVPGSHGDHAAAALPSSEGGEPRPELRLVSP